MARNRAKGPRFCKKHPKVQLQQVKMAPRRSKLGIPGLATRGLRVKWWCRICGK